MVGRAERGLSVQLSVTRGSRTIPPDSVLVVVSPSGAAVVGTGGTLALVTAGALTINATFADGVVTSRVLDVATPPTIVFDMVVGGNRDVYRVSLDGADLQRLTTDAAEDSDPTSALGRVVFTSYRDGNAELYSITQADGLARLTTTAANETQAALSPDGARVAFVRDDGGVQRVWVGTATATGAAALTSGYGFAAMVEAGPSWSPGSDSLLLMSTAGGNAAIFAVSRVPGAIPAVVAPAAADSARVEPSWSNSAARFALVSGAAVSQVFVVDRMAGTTTKLTSGSESAGQPAWLPDGRVVFTQFTSGQGSIRWVDPAIPSVVHVVVNSSFDASNPAPDIP